MDNRPIYINRHSNNYGRILFPKGKEKKKEKREITSAQLPGYHWQDIVAVPFLLGGGWEVTWGQKGWLSL